MNYEAQSAARHPDPRPLPGGVAKPKRQTAGNNPVLARIKATMNGPIYKRSLELWNTEGSGAVMAYLGRFFNDDARGRCIASMFRG